MSEVEDLRAATREAHEAIKDLRAVIQEAFDVLAQVKIAADRKALDEDMGEAIRNGLEESTKPPTSARSPTPRSRSTSGSRRSATS